MAKKNNKTDDQFAQVEGALTKTEQFFEDNQKKIARFFGGIVAVVAIYLGYQNFYMQPLELEAQTEMYSAEINFAKDSFSLALNGDEQYLGFIDIADDYSSTKAGKLANYYAGLSYLYLGEYENAIDYLEDFNSNDIVLSSLAIGCIGDAYLELDDKEKALSYYKKAANNHNNEFTTPRFLMKQATVFEILDEHDKALALYNRINEEYKQSREGQNVAKYISRAKNR
tara:strand:- start:504 stop:1184 length:681 start_codon:yes stop_codon:yes gene_type:complete